MRLALIGDVHEHWSEDDARLLDAEGYDLVLLVGDLAAYTVAGGLRTARRVAALRTPALMIPGNHDAAHVGQLATEVFRTLSPLREVFGARMARRVRALREALGPVTLGGYSAHRFGDLHVVCARPHTFGGSRPSYPRYMRSLGVSDMRSSADKLRALVESVPRDAPLVILAHNGPTGLGDRAEDICGRDFHPDEGDWGDPDLRAMIEHALDLRYDLRAVVFGHMHHHLRGGRGRRTWQTTRGGVLYVNAARVPRVEDGAHHHVALRLEAGEIRAEERWLR